MSEDRILPLSEYAPIRFEWASKWFDEGRMVDDLASESNVLIDWDECIERCFDAQRSFVENGENIFHVEDVLRSMLINTSVDNVRISDLRLPFGSIYIYWGYDQSLEVSRSSYFDGAYISQHLGGDFTSVYLTIRNSELPFLENIGVDYVDYFEKEPYYHFVLPESFSTIGSAKSAGYIDDDLSIINANISDISISNALNLVVNTLCFYSSDHSDSSLKFHSSTPRSFVAKDLNLKVSSKHSIRNVSKAKAQGYKKINYLGHTLKEYKSSINQESTSNSIHWRRGHWRNQLIGKNRLASKLIWIKPVLIGSGKKGAQQINKHIYITNKNQ